MNYEVILPPANEEKLGRSSTCRVTSKMSKRKEVDRSQEAIVRIRQ